MRDAHGEPREYEVKVRGRLSRALESEFRRQALSVSVEPVTTVLHGVFVDQAALAGLLHQIEGLSLDLVEVRKVATRCDGDETAESHAWRGA
jgi:hypothetical protein